MLIDKKILEKIKEVKAVANHLIEEATILEKMLGEVSTSPTTLKGKPELESKIRTEFRKSLFK